MASSQVKSYCNSNTVPKPNLFGIYVHIPFCIHKCSYCDFYSFTKFSRSDFESFAEVLVQEIENYSVWLKAEGRENTFLSSIFFGGGTPSLLPVDLLAKLVKAIDDHFPRQPQCEFTLEANPETVTPELCREWKKLSVNRVSLGAQSFSVSSLKALERLGSPESIERAAESLQQNGFENFSLDLIFGIPGQTWNAISEDLNRAASLKPKHLSFYNLTLKPGHALYAKLPKDDLSADWYEAGVSQLAELGYRRYEISNFSVEGYESRHNLLYWDGGEFIGAGPSAASRLFHDGRFFHKKQVSEFSRYLKEAGRPPAWTQWEATTHSQTVLEATFLELRKREGVHLPSFSQKYAHDLTSSTQYSRFLKEGLIEEKGEFLRLTDKGFLLADTVTAELAP